MSDTIACSANISDQISMRKCRIQGLMLGLAVSGIIAGCGGGYAADFVVDTPTIIQNGSAANTLDGNDSLTITKSGEIAVTGAHAVDASGNSNEVTNAGLVEVNGDFFNGINLLADFNTITNTSMGTITTNGEESVGIEGESYTTVMNDGQIAATGLDARGIDLRDHNQVTNNGSISTGVGGEDAIRVLEFNTVINSGTITTMGDDANAIEANSDNVIINNGVLTTYGISSYGINSTDDVFLTNNGSIMVMDGTGMRGTKVATIVNNGVIFIEDGEGINAEDDAVVINTGTIEVVAGDASNNGIDITSGVVVNSGSIITRGVDTDAIESDRSAIVSNSGKVVSAGANSFHFTDDSIFTGEHKLNVLAPSFIGGTIDLGTAFTTDTAVNIKTGASHSILWDFSTGNMLGADPTIGGTVPWFYDSATKQIATFDPSVLAASVETLTDRTALISATIQRRLEAADLVINGIQRGKPDDYDSEINVGNFDKSGAWVQVLGSKSNNGGNASLLDRDIVLGGLAVGYDGRISDNKRFGVMAGYIDGSSEASSRWSKSFESDSSGFFAAGYARKSIGSLFVDLGLSAGFGTDNETKRFVNDNLAALGESYAMGDPGTSFWLSPEIAIGTQIGTMSNWTVAPSAKLRYAAEWFGSYTETGPSAAANAKVDDRMVAIGEARLELAASRDIMISHLMRASVTVRGGALGRASLGEDATITLLGVTRDVSDFYEDSFAIFAGLDARVAVSDRLRLDLSTSATHGNDMTNFQGAAALGVAF